MVSPLLAPPSPSHDDNGLRWLARAERFCSTSGGGVSTPCGSSLVGRAAQEALPTDRHSFSAQFSLALANNSSSSPHPSSFVHLTTCFSPHRVFCLLFQESSANSPQSWLQLPGRRRRHPPWKLVCFFAFHTGPLLHLTIETCSAWWPSSLPSIAGDKLGLVV